MPWWRTLYFALFLGLGVVYYYFFGPGPTVSELSQDLPWWRPAGWLLRWDPVTGLASLAKSGGPGFWLPILVFCVPPFALFAAGLRLFRGALPRAGSLALALSLCLFVVYGYLTEGAVWRFFSWRFAVTSLSVGATIALLVFAPSLLRGLLARPRAEVALVLLGAFAGVFLLSTEITGTDPSLRANLSPWPALTLFGFLLAGYCIAALHIAAGCGLLLRSFWPGAISTTLGVVVPALLGGGMAYLIFEGPGPSALGSLALASTLYAGIAGARLGRDPTASAHSATARLAAGLLMASFIFVSNRAALSFLDTARNQRSAEVIAALGAYRETHSGYPDELEQLVPRFLEGVPRARMGLIRNAGEEFVYTNFGDSYALEFAAVQWVQCAYSPPYLDAEEDAPGDAPWAGPEDVGAGGPPLGNELDAPTLEGSWSCESVPPSLW